MKQIAASKKRNLDSQIVWYGYHVVTSGGSQQENLGEILEGKQTGLWASSLQVKQKVVPQGQYTSKASPDKSLNLSTALLQFGPGQNVNFSLSTTKDSKANMS